MILDEEYVVDRIEQIQECIDNLPDSELVPVWQRMIENLKKATIWR